MCADISVDSAMDRSSSLRQEMATRAMFLVAGMSLAAWAPLVPFALQRLGIEDGSLGLLLLCLGLGSIVAMPTTGTLASRFGCRAVMTGATAVIALTLPCLALAGTVPGLAATLALFGAGVGTVDVAVSIQAIAVQKTSGRPLMSGFHGFFSLGGIVGAGGVTLLLNSGLSPLQATLTVVAAALTLLLLAYRGLLSYGDPDAAAAPFFVLPRGIVLLIGALCFIAFLGEGSVLDWSALFLIGTKNVDVGHAGFGYAVFAAAMTTGRFLGDRLVARVGNRRVLIGGGAVTAFGFLLAVSAPSTILAFAGFLMVGLGASNIVPVLFTATGQQTRMPASLAVSAVTTIGYSGVLTGPALIGLVAQRTSLGIALLILAGGFLSIAVIGPKTLRH